ncbi:MAG TPA: response regulator [Pyrinomonadaceae bacterium]|nr:response regulator [Pyrinomonadaceae bacterium]
METKLILLVEDNPDDELLLLRALKKNHILNSVVVARDGVEALDYLFSTGTYEGNKLEKLPELVLLDLKLPKINGLEVLKRMRADRRTKYVPVVVLTSSTEEEDIINSYDLGANGFVQKPVNFNEFVEAANRLGVYWLGVNRAVYPK